MFEVAIKHIKQSLSNGKNQTYQAKEDKLVKHILPNELDPKKKIQKEEWSKVEKKKKPALDMHQLSEISRNSNPIYPFIFLYMLLL